MKDAGHGGFPRSVSGNMATDKKPTVIKKYANRRLYHTGTSTYVTLEDLAGMVRKGEDFVVYDAKSGEEITRSVLAQIIFEQENKEGPNLLPVTVLRQLIRFYGDSMQALVPSYLEFSMNNLSQEQQKLRDQMAQAFGSGAFQAMEEQVRKNMGFFTEAMRMFAPFPQGLPGAPETKSAAKVEKGEETNDLDNLKQQMADMQAKLDKLASK
jgi:polyhydroxyalkanoate synthesis repressor PhaR